MSMVFGRVVQKRSKNALRIGLVILMLASSLPAVGLSAHAAGSSSFIISFRARTSFFEESLTLASIGGRVTGRLDGVNAVVATVEPGRLDALRSNRNVLSVEEDLPVTASDLQADQQILANQVWTQGVNGTGVRVAILDTGISTSNTEFQERIVGCHTEVSGTTSCEDDNGHGTHVAGIAGAAGVNSAAKGVAPSIQFMSDKVLDSTGSGSISQIISGIQWAVSNGARVISMSLSTQPSDNGGTSANCDSAFPSLASAVNNAVANGVTVVAAAGNSGSQGLGAPGCLSSVIAVGAVDSTGSVASFSSVGAALADHGVTAPGVNIYSTWLSGTYKTLSGTSMATPMVSGSVALLLSRNTTLTPANVRSVLFSTSQCVQVTCPNTSEGHGLVNALAAISGTGQGGLQIGFNFGIGTSPASASIAPGASASSTVSLSLLAGTSQQVTLSTAVSPASSTISTSLTGSSGIPPFTTTLNVQTSPSTPIGTYTVTVSGSSGGLVHTASFVVSVVSAVQDFSLSTFPSGTVQMFEGGIASVFVLVVPQGSQTMTVSLALSGPAGFYASISPNPVTLINGGTGIAIVTVIDASLGPGTYTLTLTGTSGSLSHSVPISVQVIF